MSTDQSIHELLARVASAYRARRMPAAADDIHASPEEGVALMRAYVRIADADTRQAVRELVETLAKPAG